MEEDLVMNVLSSFAGRRSELIAILQEVQARFGFLPEDAMLRIASFLSVPESKVYSVASFYTQFRLTPIGRNLIRVCRGITCHINGAPKTLEAIEGALGIKAGETSSDLEYTLETVACFGCCALAPVIKVNEDVHGKLTSEKTQDLFSASRSGE